MRPLNEYEVAFLAAESTDQPYQGDGYIVLPITTSTMDDADRAIAHGKGHGYTIVALQQTNGVGSFDPKLGARRSWASPMGNLYMSRIVHINREKGEHGEHIITIAACAAGEVARRLISQAHVNLAWLWPNDLVCMLDDGSACKFGGALVKTEPNKDDPNKVVLGLGVNVETVPTQSILRTDSKIIGATSLRACQGKEANTSISAGLFMQHFINAFETKLHFVRTYGYNALLENMGFSNRQGLALAFKDTGQQVAGHFNGYVTDISPDGILTDYVLIHHRGSRERYPVRAFQGMGLIPR